MLETTLSSLWAIIAGVGLMFALYDAAMAYSHYNLVHQGWPDQNRLLEFTRLQMYGQIARAILLVMFLVIGFNDLFDGSRTISVVSLFIGNSVIVAMAIYSNRYRRKVWNYARRRDEDSSLSSNGRRRGDDTY